MPSTRSLAFAICLAASNNAFALSTSPPQPVVVDVNNSVVGPLLDDFDRVLISIGDAGYFFVFVSRAGFIASVPPYYYKSNDCTGQRYLIAGDLVNQAFVNGNILTYSRFEQGINGTFGSIFVPGDGRCFKRSATLYAAPVLTTTVSSLHVTPPFRVIAK